MPEAATYPLLRPQQRRPKSWWTRPPAASPRVLAILLLAAALIAGVVIARRPPPPDAHALLADTAKTLAAGNYSAARRNGERAVAAAPRSVRAHLLLAQAWLQLGNGLAAEAELVRAQDVGAAAARVAHLLAHARLLQGDLTGAIAAADRVEAGRAWPYERTYARRIHARALAGQGQVAAAQTLLIGLTSAAPRDAAVWTDLGRLRLNAGELGLASVAAARAVRLAPGEPAALTLQGELVRARFGLMAALPWFAAALTRDAYFHPALIEYAATLGDAGRNAGALAATRKALLARPGSPPALYLQAVIAARAGRPELAGRLLAAAGDEVSTVPGAMLLQSTVDQAAGRREQAVAGLRRLVARQPLNLAARRLLGAALLHSGDPRSALDVLRPVALRPDADSYALALVARAWEAAGERGPATFFLDRAESGLRGPATLFASDDPVGALTAEAAQAAADPTYALGLVRGMMTAGDRAGALAKVRGLAAAAPGDPAAQLALADTLAALGDHAAAAGVFARAANLQFDEPTALKLIDALGRADKPRDAAVTLALYLRQNPQSLTGQRLLGHWQAATGAWTAAIETLEAVRQRAGDRDAALLADLALAYAGDGENAVGRAYGRAAYRLQPLNPAVADAYGVALAADGEARAARQLLDKAVSLAPGDPVFRAHRRQLG